MDSPSPNPTQADAAESLRLLQAFARVTSLAARAEIIALAEWHAGEADVLPGEDLQ